MKISQYRDGLSEAQFQAMVTARAHAFGWLVHHDRGDYRQAIGGNPGFPDLVLARAGQVIFAELKSARGKVTPSQTLWLEALTPTRSLFGIGSPGGAVVWRPDDWPDVQKVLDRP